MTIITLDKVQVDEFLTTAVNSFRTHLSLIKQHFLINQMKYASLNVST